MLTKNLVSSLTLGMALTAIPAYALAAPTPNLYELQGQNVNVTYSTTSFDGTPRLNYKDQQRTLQFVGDQIRTAKVEIGTLVTVTLYKTRDNGYVTFSLLLPPVNLGQGNESKIVTKGITTVNRFSKIYESQQGQTKFYTIIPLSGTAQAVAF
ncbi:MAG: hypothetical protein RM021_028615 [Nostoc sp. EkiNYC01]|nr:hypothetical protein [Nostoc sp. EkiNYC01]